MDVIKTVSLEELTPGNCTVCGAPLDEGGYVNPADCAGDCNNPHRAEEEDEFKELKFEE